MTAPEIFIYCDDASHAPKRSPVDVFVALPDGGWHERPPKKKIGRAGHVGSGMHMLGSDVARDGWALDPDKGSGLRTRYELVCDRTPQCRRRPLPAQQGNLFAALDSLRGEGIDRISLPVLAAMMGEQAERHPLD